MADPLDNPIWYALSGPQANEASGTAHALRFAPDVAWFCAVADPLGTGVGALAGIAEPGEIVALFTTGTVTPLVGWEPIFHGRFEQMVCDQLPVESAKPDNLDMVALGAEDVDDMLTLAQLTEPGPFLARTNTLGDFVGVRVDGALAAMAGQRLRIDGATEISAVCTHPDMRGRGYAGQLVHTLASRIVADGQRAFLHVSVDNVGARRLYERIGFATRTTITIQVFRIGGEF